MCLPFTFTHTREGSLSVSIMLIVVIAVLSISLSLCLQHESSTIWWIFPLVFVFGAFVSEVIFFIYYYFDNGYNDPKLSVGIAVAIIEFIVISGISSIAIVAAYAFYK